VLKLYYAPRTRAARVMWLLEELELPYELERGEFRPPATQFFAQSTPTGKYPTLEDGDVTMIESGAIVEYILERYGEGRLAPAVGAPDRAAYLQWLHYAESTAFPPIGIIVWLTRYRGEDDALADLLEDARARAASGFTYLDTCLGDKTWLLGEMFSAADIMMGFTLIAAQSVGALEDVPRLQVYVRRLLERPALQKVVAAQ